MPKSPPDEDTPEEREAVVKKTIEDDPTGKHLSAARELLRRARRRYEQAESAQPEEPKKRR